MSLSAAFSVISSSFAANSAQTAVVANNIANVNTPGYSREIANVATNSYGGADVGRSLARPTRRSSSRSRARPRRPRRSRRFPTGWRRWLRPSTTAPRRLRPRARTRTAPRPRRCSPIFKPRLRPTQFRRLRRPPPTLSCRPPPISPRRSTAGARRSSKCASRLTRTWLRRSARSIRSEPVHHRQQRRRDRTSNRRQCRQR